MDTEGSKVIFHQVRMLEEAWPCMSSHAQNTEDSKTNSTDGSVLVLRVLPFCLSSWQKKSVLALNVHVRV